MWSKDTRAVRVSETVFFKHNYLTIPTITPEAVSLKAAEYLKKAIEGNIPQFLQTKEGVKQLMKISNVTQPNQPIQ